MDAADCLREHLKRKRHGLSHAEAKRMVSETFRVQGLDCDEPAYIDQQEVLDYIREQEREKEETHDSSSNDRPIRQDREAD